MTSIIINRRFEQINLKFKYDKFKTNIQYRRHHRKLHLINCTQQKNEIAFGIDLGTTNSVISTVINNEPQIIK